MTITSARENTEARAIFFFASPPLDYDHHDTRQQQDILADAFSAEQWEVSRLLKAMRSALDFYFDSASQIRMDNWSAGRVTLLGDAGYCPSRLRSLITTVRNGGGCSASRSRYRSAEELRDNGLQHLHDAVALLESKATTAELDGYRHFVLALVHKVAAARREGGQSVTPAAQRPLDRSGPRHDRFSREGEDTERGELAAAAVQARAIRA